MPYFTIGFIIGLIYAIAVLGPLFLEIVDRQRAAHADPLPPVKHYFEALDYCFSGKGDPELFQIFFGIAAVLFFLSWVLWPLTLAVAIIIAALYFISINKEIRSKTKKAIDTITKTAEEYAGD